jgi:hypothetical protein
MPELKLYVPTYYGDADTDAQPARGEFDDPLVPVVVRDADGLRIVLGSHDYWDAKCPDVQVERRAGGWMIFLHPVGGSDASGFVFMFDDGGSVVVPESPVGPTPPIKTSTWAEAVKQVDARA